MQSFRRSRGLAGAIFLVAFTFSATMLLQRWIGALTIYAPDVESKRLQLHSAILAHVPPSGQTWESIGARGTSTRIATVWLAEGLHRTAGIPVLKAYLFIDTVSLWASLVLLVVLLRQWSPSISNYSLLGLLYYISILPLTYFFYFFHPWDRVSQCLWIVLLICIRRNRYALLAATLALSMIVKYDTAFVPAIYWFANVTRRTLISTSLRTIALFVLELAIIVGLGAAFSGGGTRPFNFGDGLARLSLNFESMLRMNVYYPPLLVHGLPTILAIYGWPHADRIARAMVVVGLGCMVPVWLVGSNFHEVRAQLPLTILLLPAALFGLKRVIDGAGRDRST
jgi:hypothetical protein